MTKPKPAWWTERDFLITFEERATFFTCKHCSLILTFPRLNGARSIEAALQAHLRTRHPLRARLQTREEA